MQYLHIALQQTQMGLRRTKIVGCYENTIFNIIVYVQFSGIFYVFDVPDEFMEGYKSNEIHP
jgi:hypothetical protein